MIEVLLGAVLAAAVVIFVAVPFLRESAPEAAPEPPDRDLAAAEERDRVLAELKELEFDHRTGKVSDEDYRALLQPLRQRAAQMLNGATLSSEAQKSTEEQHFSDASLPNSRSDR